MFLLLYDISLYILYLVLGRMSKSKKKAAENAALKDGVKKFLQEEAYNTQLIGTTSSQFVDCCRFNAWLLLFTSMFVLLPTVYNLVAKQTRLYPTARAYSFMQSNYKN